MAANHSADGQSARAYTMAARLALRFRSGETSGHVSKPGNHLEYISPCMLRSGRLLR